MQNLSASDLLSLEAAFHTAREDDAEEPSRGGQVVAPALSRSQLTHVESTDDLTSVSNDAARTRSGTGRPRTIKSRALVDSNNEESTSDEDDDERGAPSAAAIALSLDDDNDEQNQPAPLRSGPIQSDRGARQGMANNKRQLSRTRALWRDQSLREMSMWWDERCANIEQLAAEQEEEDEEELQQQQATGSGGKVKVNAECSSQGGNRLPVGLRRAAVRIQVDTCASIDESLNQQQQQQQQLQSPVAPPPSMSSSALDLRDLLQSCDSRLLSSIAAGSSVSRSTIDMTSQHQRQETSATIFLSTTTKSDAQRGSLSDSSAYKLTKFTTWKKANKYITRVHENPFNLHLDCLERLAELEKRLDSKIKVDNNKSERSKIQTQGSTGNDKVATEILTRSQKERKQQDSQQQVAQSTSAITNENSPQAAAEAEASTGVTGVVDSTGDLTNYAQNLTHLYRRNQEIMDSSNDFRTLLYNIICCLLVQDDQVLATPSVSKMLDVIRTHLDSASRVYAHTSAQLISNLTRLNQQQQRAQAASCCTATAAVETGDLPAYDCRKTSSGSLGTGSATSSPAGTASDQSATNATSGAGSGGSNNNVYDLLRPDTMNRTNQKPADFRRISSVSYNDEQLINDLCSDPLEYRQVHGPQARSGSLTTPSGRQNDREHAPSPWAYQELSERRSSGPKSPEVAGNNSASGSQQYTSQSSLEQLTPRLADPLQNDDSGNGTMYDFQIVSDFGCGVGSRRASADLIDRCASLNSESFLAAKRGFKYDERRQLRRLSDFKPKQQPSYMSTDDYLSSNNNNNNTPNRTSFYDDDGDYSSALQKCQLSNSSQQQQSDLSDEADEQIVDVASRRAELEWTLNKLINIELKLTWLTSKDTLRRAIRKIGVPNEIRPKVWLILIEQMIGSTYDVKGLIEQARATIVDQDELHVRLDDETQSILKQIELDVNRTMPGHRLFDDGAEGGVKLRRILVAYSIHVNRAIAYCQGFNFIVALLLSVFEGDEEKALRGFICIVDHIFPSKYYFDHYLTGARADQFLLADFICDQLIKNPTLAERKMVEGITSSITLNWFISLFHGAVPTLTRLTILDHFILEGVKALFRFTMAILYLAFQVTPPSKCEIFTTIRNTARDMYDIKLLLSIVNQIKLPKDSYFAIRRSFYMVQSSFNSDQFYMQSLSSSGTSRNLASNKPLSVQQQLQPDKKAPAMSLMSSSAGQGNLNIGAAAACGGAAAAAHATSAANAFTIRNSICTDNAMARPRTRTSADRSKICIQSIGKLGRSHLRIIHANNRSAERALMSPLRNCILIGIGNCGKDLIIARQSSKRNFKCFKEQDLTFHIHEISTEIFDGFYLEEAALVVIITQLGEIFKINCRKCARGSSMNQPNYLEECTETLMLRDIGSRTLATSEHDEKVKLRLSTMDSLTNLLWIYVECEDMSARADRHRRRGSSQHRQQQQQQQGSKNGRLQRTASPTPYAGGGGGGGGAQVLPQTTVRFRNNNPFLDQLEGDEFVADDLLPANVPPSSPAAKGNAAFDHWQQLVAACGASGLAPPTAAAAAMAMAGANARPSLTRKIIIVDIITFDLFSAFALHPNFGEITNLRASLVAFCQLSNPMSNQFSTRIVQIGPTGRYEQLLSFSDVVDYMVSVPESYRKKYNCDKQQQAMSHTLPAASTSQQQQQQQQRYSSLKRLLTHSISFSISSSSSNSTGGPSSSCVEHSQLDVQQTRVMNESGSSGTLTRYYRSLIKSYSMNLMDQEHKHSEANDADDKQSTSADKSESSGSHKLQQACGMSDTREQQVLKRRNRNIKPVQDDTLRSIISSSFGDFSELSETNYIPVNMAFIFRNGKIALFEFTESYAIHTRESQLDRYDYSKVIDVSKNGDDFIVTILTVFDKLIKVII